MKWFTYGAAILCFVLLFAGCNWFVDNLRGGEGGIRSSENGIRTDRTTYQATSIDLGGAEGLELTIPMLFTNTTANTVYFVGCQHPPMPVLEKKVGATWVTAWAGVELMCLSPPWPIEPGGTFRDTLQLAAAWPGQNMEPTFRTDVPGRYRLVRSVHVGPDPSAPQIPQEARVSNEFNVVWKSE